jgi:hypothetical protein
MALSFVVEKIIANVFEGGHHNVLTTAAFPFKGLSASLALMHFGLAGTAPRHSLQRHSA